MTSFDSSSSSSASGSWPDLTASVHHSLNYENDDSGVMRDKNVDSVECRNVSGRYYHTVAALNNVGTLRLKDQRFEEAMACFETAHHSILEIQSLLERPNSNQDIAGGSLEEFIGTLKVELYLQQVSNQPNTVRAPVSSCTSHCQHHPSSNIPVAVPVNTAFGRMYLRRIPEPISLSVSVADIDKIRSVETILNTNSSTNGGGPIVSPAIYVDASELTCRTDELGFLAIVSLYNLALATWMKSHQLVQLQRHPQQLALYQRAMYPTLAQQHFDDEKQMYDLARVYRLLARERFQTVLQMIEHRIATIGGGDIHFFLSIAISMLVLNGASQIAIEEQDLRSGQMFAVSITCSFKIISMWHEAADTFWGTTFKGNLAAAA